MFLKPLARRLTFWMTLSAPSSTALVYGCSEYDDLGEVVSDHAGEVPHGLEAGCVIHEHGRCGRTHASDGVGLFAWTSCRTSRNRQARPVLSRCLVRLRLVSSCNSVRLSSFLSHRYLVRLSGGLERPSVFPALSTASLACLATWNLSTIRRAWGRCSRMPFRKPGLMSQAAGRTYSGTPLWSMKSRVNRSTVAESLPGGHVGHVVLGRVGDRGDVVAAPAAGLVDADGLRSRVVLRLPRPVHGTGDAWQSGVDERLVLEEVRMAPHALPPVMRRAGAPGSPSRGNGSARRARSRS